MRIFFNGLNELRGIAALAVVISHIELFKHREKIKSLYDGFSFEFIDRLGKNGVYLFFVLSGFLITYLLLSEIRQKGDIHALKFYIRRMLRIWPLYYLVVVISFFVFPVIIIHFDLLPGTYYYILADTVGEDIVAKLLLFVFFLPNLALVLFKPVAGVSQSWSVGVEEQFYILWPQLLKRFKNNVLPLLVAVIVIKVGLQFGLQLLNGILKLKALKIVGSFLNSFNIELMALGGIGAWMLFNDRLQQYKSKFHAAGKYVLLALIALCLWFPVPYFTLGVLFLVFILLNTDDTLYVFRNKTFSFLGEISYGIYMYHPIMMFFSFAIVHSVVTPENTIAYNVLIYLCTFTLTILISYLSFRYYESFFLRMKERFVLVPSGKKV